MEKKHTLASVSVDIKIARIPCMCFMFRIHRIHLQHVLLSAVPPKMLDNQLRVEGIEGTEAMISCRASGLPSPKYEFYKVSGRGVDHHSVAVLGPMWANRRTLYG